MILGHELLQPAIFLPQVSDLGGCRFATPSPSTTRPSSSMSWRFTPKRLDESLQAVVLQL